MSKQVDIDQKLQTLNNILWCTVLDSYDKRNPSTRPKLVWSRFSQHKNDLRSLKIVYRLGDVLNVSSIRSRQYWFCSKDLERDFNKDNVTAVLKEHNDIQSIYDLSFTPCTLTHSILDDEALVEQVSEKIKNISK